MTYQPDLSADSLSVKKIESDINQLIKSLAQQSVSSQPCASVQSKLLMRKETSKNGCSLIAYRVITTIKVVIE